MYLFVTYPFQFFPRQMRSIYKIIPSGEALYKPMKKPAFLPAKGPVLSLFLIVLYNAFNHFCYYRVNLYGVFRADYGFPQF